MEDNKLYLGQTFLIIAGIVAIVFLFTDCRIRADRLEEKLLSNAESCEEIVLITRSSSNMTLVQELLLACRGLVRQQIIDDAIESYLKEYNIRK